MGTAACMGARSHAFSALTRCHATQYEQPCPMQAAYGMLSRHATAATASTAAAAFLGPCCWPSSIVAAAALCSNTCVRHCIYRSRVCKHGKLQALRTPSASSIGCAALQIAPHPHTLLHCTARTKPLDAWPAQSALGLRCGSSTRVPRQFTVAPARHSCRSSLRPCNVYDCGTRARR